MPMSATPSWAITEPSTYSTIECTIDCGCTTTCTCSGARSNSQRASMTSSPLFIRVAESIVILAPIFQVGMLERVLHRDARRASAGRLAERPAGGGEQDRGARRPRLWPTRHWKIALCSESTGSSAHAARAGGRGHQAARHHQRLLVGERHRACPPRSRPWSAAGPRRPRAPRATTSASTSPASVDQPVGARRAARAAAPAAARASRVDARRRRAGRPRAARTCGRARRAARRWSRARRGPPRGTRRGSSSTSSSVRSPIGAGGAEQRHALHRGTPRTQREVVEAPAKLKSRLSMRSSTPPWPGMSPPVSLVPTLRLMHRLREIADLADHAEQRARRRPRPSSRSAGQEPARAATTAGEHRRTTCATAPSTVLRGLTTGASLWRPSVEPTR